MFEINLHTFYLFILIFNLCRYVVVYRRQRHRLLVRWVGCAQNY